MSLTPEQKQAVASWVAAGDNLSAVQKKLLEQFKLSLTYRDVRFLVDDLSLDLKDPAPKIDTSDVTKAAVPKPATPAKRAASEKKAAAAGADDLDQDAEGTAQPADAELDEDTLPPEDLEDALPPEGAASNVTVTIDKVTLIPSALASGTVTFSDGVTGKWIVDQYGRPGFTEVSQPGYRPKPADAQAFMQELSAALQQRGF